MDPFFDNRVDIIWRVPARERLVNIGIRQSANSYKVKRVVRLETSVCFHITVVMNNQLKGRRKGTSPKRRESEDKGAVAIVKSVSQLGCVLQDLDALDFKERKIFGETRCKKSWTQFKEFDSLSLRYVTRVSGTRKDHRLDK